MVGQAGRSRSPSLGSAELTTKRRPARYSTCARIPTYRASPTRRATGRNSARPPETSPRYSAHLTPVAHASAALLWVTGAELAVLGGPLSPCASLRCYAPAACAACQPGFTATKLKPANRRTSLEPKVNKNATEVFVVPFHAVVQRANVPLIQEAQHSLF